MSNDPHVPPNISFDEDGNVRRSAELEALVKADSLDAQIAEETGTLIAVQRRIERLQAQRAGVAKPHICRNCGREIPDESGCPW